MAIPRITQSQEVYRNRLIGLLFISLLVMVHCV
jgi:hypothetical protein